MPGFIDSSNGSYYEGDNKGFDVEVPSRPSPFHGWTGEAWQLNQSAYLADACEVVRVALQKAIDLKAETLGFSSGNALMLYASFANPFKALALPFAQWEATVWAEAEAYKQEVIANTKPMLSGEQAVELMPPLELP